jgi:hypothetical protein
MGRDLRCLYNLLKTVDCFYMLAITFDQHPPDFRRFVRLYDGAGNPVDAGKKVFWLNRSLIENMLVKIRRADNPFGNEAGMPTPVNMRGYYLYNC